jgi:hypothetical protein
VVGQHDPQLPGRDVRADQERRQQHEAVAVQRRGPQHVAVVGAHAGCHGHRHDFRALRQFEALRRL